MCFPTVNSSHIKWTESIVYNDCYLWRYLRKPVVKSPTFSLFLVPVFSTWSWGRSLSLYSTLNVPLCLLASNKFCQQFSAIGRKHTVSLSEPSPKAVVCSLGCRDGLLFKLFSPSYTFDMQSANIKVQKQLQSNLKRRFYKICFKKGFKRDECLSWPDFLSLVIIQLWDPAWEHTLRTYGNKWSGI